MRGKYVRLDRSWKSEWSGGGEYFRHVEAEESWQNRCTALLFNITKCLNDYADLVRRDVDPGYFLLEGRFYVLDSLGTLGGGVFNGGTVHFVEEYLEVPDE